MFKELLAEAWPLIEKFSPLIATGLLGPLAGTSVTILESVFDGSIHNPKDLVNKIINNPIKEDLLKACNNMKINDSDFVSLWNKLGRPTKLNIEWTNEQNIG